MKKLLLSTALLVILLQSCTVTKGVYDASLKSTDPYKLTFSGTQGEFESAIKRFVVQNGFSIADFDKDAGILATQYKELPDDEKYNASMAMLAGVNVSSQKGKILFIYKKESEQVNFEMSSYLVVNGQYQKNTLSEAEIGTGAQKLPQGHPLNMKYKNILLQDARFKLL